MFKLAPIITVSSSCIQKLKVLERDGCALPWAMYMIAN